MSENVNTNESKVILIDISPKNRILQVLNYVRCMCQFEIKISIIVYRYTLYCISYFFYWKLLSYIYIFIYNEC